MLNEQANKYLEELEEGTISPESMEWYNKNIYQGTESLYYALTEGGYLSPNDIYSKDGANKVKEALEIVLEFLDDYSLFIEEM